MEKEIEVDSHKLIYHPKRVSEYIEKGDCYPIYIEFGLTNACNHKCVFCALDYLPNGGNFFNSDVMIKNLKLMAEKGVKSIMFAGEGEPLLHKDIGTFTKKAKEFGMDVSITTNGILFDTKKMEECLPNLSWIRFSIDSGSPDNYSLVHGTNKDDFEKLMKNLKEAVLFREKNNLTVTIGAQFLMINLNLGEVELLAQRLKEIGIDNLQIKPYSHHPSSKNNFSVDNEKFEEMKEKLEKINTKDFKIIFRKNTQDRIQEGINYPECFGLPFFALVDTFGNVIPCNLYYGMPEFTYGNLNEMSFQEIWEGEKRKKVIEKIRDHGVAECRKGCRLDSINRYLHRIKFPKDHDNFI